MAVELCSDNSGLSPRISFSLDLSHFDEVPVDQRPLRSSKPSSLNSSIDFDFCVGGSSEQQQPSSADELFSDGKILPTDIKKNDAPSKQTDHQPSPPPLPHQDVISSTKESKKEDDQKQSSSKTSSFWGFKRSRSFTCGSGYGRSLCPLPLLSRSNSTGSTPNPKQPSNNNPKQMKHASANYHKPPLKKTAAAYKPYGNNNGVHVNNPVFLNVPSANLFGLSSIFFNGRAKNHHHCKRK